MNLQNKNSSKVRKPIIKIDLDPMLMKIPTEDKIRLRMKLVKILKQKMDFMSNKIKGKNKIRSADFLGFGIFYNHLTPNRSVEAYNYLYKNPKNKLEQYYSNVIKNEESFMNEMISKYNAKKSLQNE